MGDAAADKPRLTCFDFAGSRGEECRIALHLAGIDFDDVRVKSADWPALKESMPFGAGAPLCTVPIDRRAQHRPARREFLPPM
jgi:hypothetical protein